MIKQRLFFATKDDLEPLLAAVESRVSIDYVRTGHTGAAVAERYAGSEHIPNLGCATTDSAVSCDSFLIVPRNQEVHARRVPGHDGTVRYFYDQLINPSTVTFAPGGLWGNEVLLHGRVATVSDDAISQTLMNEFAKALRRSFRVLKAFWIGPDAENLLDAGKR